MKDDGLYECHVGIVDKSSRNKVILDSGSIVLTVIGRRPVISHAKHHDLQRHEWC